MDQICSGWETRWEGFVAWVGSGRGLDDCVLGSWRLATVSGHGLDDCALGSWQQGMDVDWMIVLWGVGDNHSRVDEIDSMIGWD